MPTQTRWLLTGAVCLAAALVGSVGNAPAGPSAGEVLSLSARDNVLLAPVRQATTAEDHETALARARQAGRELSRDGLAELFMLAGQCYEAKSDLARAGLCYMRLVIHFPKDRQTPEAMLRSARIARQFARERAATMLYETLVQRYPGTSQAAAAREALKTRPSPEPKAPADN